MVANVTGPAAIRNNINSLRVPHGTCEKCNGVIYLQQLGCGRCLRSAQKLNENNSSDSFEWAVQTHPEVVYNCIMEASMVTNRKVTFSHPDLPLMGTMTGHVVVDAWEGEEFFYPDSQYHQKLVDRYGVEPVAGLFLIGAAVGEMMA